MTTLATALLVLPIIFSPISAFAPTFAMTGNSIISKVGFDVVKDSYTAITLTASG